MQGPLTFLGIGFFFALLPLFYLRWIHERVVPGLERVAPSLLLVLGSIAGMAGAFLTFLWLTARTHPVLAYLAALFGGCLVATPFFLAASSLRRLRRLEESLFRLRENYVPEILEFDGEYWRRCPRCGLWSFKNPCSHCGNDEVPFRRVSRKSRSGRELESA